MKDRELADLLRNSSPKELWVITWNNLLKILFCPFKVMVKNDIGILKKDTIVWVEEVKVTQELKTVFIIKGVAYYYHHFDIIEQEN